MDTRSSGRVRSAQQKNLKAVKGEKGMLKVGDLVEVVKPFYWYDDRYEIGQRFVIEAQHVGHNFEAWVKVVAGT